MGNRPTHSTAGRSWPRDVRDLFRGSRSRRHNDRHRVGGEGVGDGPSDGLVDGTTGDECPSAVGAHPTRGTAAGGSSVGGRGAHFDKLNSCPDLQSVSKSGQQQRLRTLQETERQPVKINYKIYRSYGELPADGANASNPRLQASCVDIPVVEVRVYRRSTETLSGAASADRRRAQSLPRGMELRRSLGSDLHGGAEALSTATYDSRRGSTSAYSRSTSRKASARSSMASIAASCRAVTPDEFPDTATVRRKVDDFERNFVAVFTDAFQCLAPLNQLAAVSVATRPDRANQAVSLLQYLESDAIPADLLLQTTAAPSGSSSELNGLSSTPLPPEDREYFLTIKPSRFPAVRRLKLEGASAVDRRLSVARELAADMAQEAAVELGRMFEYQLALIIEPVAVRLLARHAVDCILQATRRRSRTLDRNALVRGVVRGRPPAADGPKFVSVFVGTRELKWNLYDVFKRPALRRELHGGNGRPGSGVSGCALNGGGSCGGSSVAISSGQFPSSPARQSERGSSGNNSELSDDGGRLAGSGSVWNFYTSSKCDPMRYGYRGQMVERDYVFGCYRINSEDESSFPEEVTTRYDDFHRVYSPVRRLASLDTLRDYCACAMRGISAGSCNSSSSSNATSATAQLADFLRRSVTTESYLRDEVDVVFRPLGVALGDYFLERAPSNPVELATLVGTIVNRGGLRSRAGKRRSRVLSWQQQQQPPNCQCPYPYKPPPEQQQQQRHVTLSLSAETIVNRRQTTSGATFASGTTTTTAAAVAGNGTGNGSGNGSTGVKEVVTNAAIEVTRACDELSGRLMRKGEFDATSAVNGGHVMAVTSPTDDQTTITDV